MSTPAGVFEPGTFVGCCFGSRPTTVRLLRFEGDAGIIDSPLDDFYEEESVDGNDLQPLDAGWVDRWWSRFESRAGSWVSDQQLAAVLGAPEGDAEAAVAAGDAAKEAAEARIRAIRAVLDGLAHTHATPAAACAAFVAQRAELVPDVSSRSWSRADSERYDAIWKAADMARAMRRFDAAQDTARARLPELRARLLPSPAELDRARKRGVEQAQRVPAWV
jgi:hypothetical protein